MKNELDFEDWLGYYGTGDRASDWDRYLGKSPTIERYAAVGKKKKRDTEEIPQYISRVYFAMIDDPVWRKNNRGPYTLYLYLRRRIVRGLNGENINDDVFHRYWKDNKYACSLSTRYLADKFGYGKNSLKMIRQFRDYLFYDGAFEYGEGIKIPGKKELQKVFILGESLHGKQIWYYDKKWVQ